MMPAEGDAGASGRSGRKSRANAGARLKDILQQEAKDLKTLEAEADEETEEAAQTAGTKKGRQTRQQHQHQQQDAAAGMNGVAGVKEEPAEHPEGVSALEAGGGETGGGAAAASQPSSTGGSKGHKKPAAATAAGELAAVAAAATAAASAAPAVVPLSAVRAIKAPLQRLPRPTKGPDEGPGAAAGQALGAVDACWSAPPAAPSSKQQQPRGTKRKRAGKASTPPPDVTTETGTEDGEDAAAAAGPGSSTPLQQQQQPLGKALPVGSRPSWLVQARAGGSAALNKRQAKGLADDLSRPQQVEFMLGCAECDYQQHGCPMCRQQPEVTRPMARWQPDKGHPQVDLAEALTFTPTREEFADPFTYIASIAERFVKQGVAKIVPPAGCWAPPQYVQQLRAACSGNGGEIEELPVRAQRQFISHLCMRVASEASSSSSRPAASTGSASQPLGVEQLLGTEAGLLQRLDELAEAGPAAAAAAAEGQSALHSSSGGDAASAQQDAAAAAAAVKQEQPSQQPSQQESSMWRQHTLRSFGAYADWAKRMHFSSQPCNAELQAVLAGPSGAGQQQQGGAGLQRRGSSMGLPPAKRPKHEPTDQQGPQPSRDTAEAEGTEDGADGDAAAESGKDRTAAQQQQAAAERHSSRLQAKGRAPLHPLKAPLGSGRGTSPEPAAAAKAKLSKPATSTTTSATPPTTPRTKAVKSGSRLVGAAAGMLGLAAVNPECAASIDAVEAEYWRLVEQQQPGRLVEVLAVPEIRSSSGGSLIQELQEQQEWGCDEQLQHGQLQQQQECAGSAWDLSSLPARRENLLRYLPLQQAIPGLTEPVLGLSSCLSSCCWQVTRQGMYGISCLHSGAPRVWYAVPESAHEAFQVAMQDCLPHLFAANPALLQQAATAVSPNELRARGVPVCRLVQEPGTFVVLLPNAYHSWLSTGLSIHESVALAPWDCLGAGCDAERSCRAQAAPPTVSQTELLVTLVSSCRCVADAHGAGGGDIEAEADEQAEAVASAALAALSRAKVRAANKPAKQPSPRKQQQQAASMQQDTDADDEPDQQGASKHKQRRQRSPGAGRKRKATSADSDSSSTYSDLDGSGSDTDRGSEQALTVSYASSTADSDGDDSGSSGSADGSDLDAEEASQPCWGAAAGAQQLLEPGLAWAGGACASAALEQVPKPAILAAVGELVLRVEEEQRRQAAARQFGVQQEQRMHGAVLPINHCSKCSADLWLSAVVSSAAPGQAVCAEHAAALPAPPDSCTLLFRHSIEELQRLLFEAAALFPGCADDVRAAQQRVRTRPTIRGLKSLGPLLQLPQKLPAPRAPELKPGGREPHTPIADWVKHLKALAAGRLPLVGNGAAARLPHKQRRTAVEEALQVAAAAFAAVQAGGSVEGIDMGQKLRVRPLKHTDSAVRLVVQQLVKHGAGRQAPSSKPAAGKAAAAAASRAGKGNKERSQQQQQRSADSAGSSEGEQEEGESSSEGEEQQEAPLQPRQRKLPGWLQAECVVDKAVAKRAKSSATAAGKAAGGSERDAAAAAAAIAASFSLPEVVRFAEQALESVATNKALAQQERQRRRQQREQHRQQQQQEALQEQRRVRQQQEQDARLSNGIAALPIGGALTAQQLAVLQQQQQLLALQQQSQQLLLAAAPVTQHRPPQARGSREYLGRESGSSGGRGKGRAGSSASGRGSSGGRGERRTSGSGGGRKGAAAAVLGSEQQQQLAAQLTLQQLQLQAQFRAAALAAAAAAAGQGASAAAAVAGGAANSASAAATAAAAAAAGAQLAQAQANAAGGFVGFPGPLITMHNGVPVLIFAAPMPQQQSGSVAATVPADPAAAAAVAAAAAATPAEAADVVQQQQLLQAQQTLQQQQQQVEPVNQAGAVLANAAAPADAAAPAAAAAAAQAAATAAAAAAAAATAAGIATGAASAATGVAPASSEALPLSELAAAQTAALAGTDAAAAAAAPAAAPEVTAAEAPASTAAPAAPPPAAAGTGAASGAGPAGAAAAAAAASQEPQQGADTLPAHSSGPLASAASMQHSSGQLTDAEAAAAAAHAEAEAVASKAAAAAVAAAAAEARLVAGIVGNGHHHQAPAMSMPLAPAATLPAPVGSTAGMQQQLSLPHALPVVTAGSAAMPPATMPLSLSLQQPAADQWQQQHQPAAAAAAAEPHPADCLLQVEEFFHSQEPGAADSPVACAAPASAPAPIAAPAAAAPAAAVAEPAHKAEVPVGADAAAEQAPVEGGAPVLPPNGASAGADATAAPAAFGAAPPVTSVKDGSKGLEPAQAAQQQRAASAGAGAGSGAAQGVQPPATGEAPAAAGGAGGVPVRRGAGGSDDQMDELELEPLVDFGMDDFDW